jgi:hypothetical protein
MWWTRAERRRGVEAVVVLAAEIMAPMTRTESTGPFLMVSGSSTVRRRGRSLEDDRARLTGTGTGFAPGPSGRARGRDDGRILVTVVSTSRLPVVAEMSRARWPSSPSARSCGCLHRGSNAQAVSKTGEAARSTRADGQRKLRRASRRARSLRSRAGAGADIARARPRARARAACAPASRAQRQGRPRLRRMRGGRPGWGAHLWMVGWYPWAVKRLVTT